MVPTNNGQSAALNLSNEQIQVLLTGKFGDGCLSTPKSCVDNSLYSSNSIHEEYVDFKMKLLGNLASKRVVYLLMDMLKLLYGSFIHMLVQILLK